MDVRILAVGDVTGKPGLDFLSRHLRSFQRQAGIDFTVVNGENANVVGIIPWQAEEIFDAGADVITLGNHTWTRTELRPYLDSTEAILRPANFVRGCPGRGWGLFEASFGTVAVLNLMGRFTLDTNTDNPFFTADEILRQADTPFILVDMHAEGTSERQAMGWYLDGRVSAVWGTHTHTQTSDGRVLPQGTGFISDLGMTGPRDSILGIEPEQSIRKFLGMPPERYRSAKGPCKLEGAIFTLDGTTGRCREVEAVRLL